MLRVKRVFSFSETGKRSLQQDAVWPPINGRPNDNCLFVVCDGLGGQANGEIASNIAVRAIHRYATNNSTDLQEMIDHAVNELKNYADLHPEAATMATTLAMACINNDTVSLAWCGDSRIIHIRDGKILYQTEDHTLAAELIAQGNLSEEGVRYFPEHRVLQRSLSPSGNRSISSTHTITGVCDNDWLVLCSDGFLELLSPQEIADLLVFKPDAEQLAIHLYAIGLAYTNDNCSGHIIQLTR